MALTSATVLTSLVLASPASAAAACGPAKTGHAGNTYQSCAASPAHGRFTATSVFKHDVGTTVFQLGTQTNGRPVVWRSKGTVKTKNARLIVNIACKPGSKVRAALRVKYHSAWEPTAYSKVVTCA
jgi:hypothetical protein